MAQTWQEMSALTLAYLGDAVYELWVRSHLLEMGHKKVRELHSLATKYVCAQTQANLLYKIMPQLEQQESQIVHRGRNAKGGHPKNVDVVTYRHATAFESLVGYWQMTGQTERMEWAFSQVDELLQEEATLSEGEEKEKVISQRNSLPIEEEMAEEGDFRES